MRWLADKALQQRWPRYALVTTCCYPAATHGTISWHRDETGKLRQMLAVAFPCQGNVTELWWVEFPK